MIDLVIVLLLLSGVACALAYRVGQLHGSEDGWWQCMAEHGEVA